MKSHEAVKKLAFACKELTKAKELTGNPDIDRLINSARSKIFDVGEGMQPDVFREALCEKDVML